LETSLYAPVKRFLEGLGFEVKGEVCGCDIVAVDRGAPIALVICELKLSFTLDLVLQAVDRSTACDEVWLAVRASLRGRGRESDPRVKRLCRLLGFGLLCVFNSGRVEVFVEPAPWRPRHNAKRRSKILDEHRRRKGDPTTGGATRRPIMTAYRQQSLACAAALARAPARPRDLKGAIPDAQKSCSTTSTVGSSGSSAASIRSPRQGRPQLFCGNQIFRSRPPIFPVSLKKMLFGLKVARAPIAGWKRS
jgi:hypothetical protein